MRIFIAVLFLILSIQSPSKANDISDFEIEGMSLGDSLLDYLSKNQIGNLKETYYNDNLYTSITVFPDETNLELKEYDALVLTFLTKDNKFILQGISGIIVYKKNIKECNIKYNEIFKEFKLVFENNRFQENNFKGKLGNVESTEFLFENDDMAIVACYDYDPHPTHTDHLRIALNRNEYLIWLEKKAYK